MEKNSPLTICHTQVHPGERITIGLPTPEIYTCAPVHMPIHILHGRRKGPTLVICAAMHGDEVNGIAIIQRLLALSLLKKLSGTLIMVPVVNIFGLIQSSRNLPDKRDLTGSFPGSNTGSYAARLAHLFSTEILAHATHCIDLHTGEPHRYRLPHIQTNLDHAVTQEMAECFGAPLAIHTSSKRGLLWQMGDEGFIPTLIYEGGEALRLDELTVRTGVKGIVRIMRYLGMIKDSKAKKPQNIQPLIARQIEEVWAPGSGLCRLHKRVGSHVQEGEVIGDISDPFGTVQSYQIKAPTQGLITSYNYLPLVNEGEPVFEIAKYTQAEKAIERMEGWQQEDAF